MKLKQRHQRMLDRAKMKKRKTSFKKAVPKVLRKEWGAKMLHLKSIANEVWWNCQIHFLMKPVLSLCTSTGVGFVDAIRTLNSITSLAEWVRLRSMLLCCVESATTISGIVEMRSTTYWDIAFCFYGEVGTNLRKQMKRFCRILVNDFWVLSYHHPCGAYRSLYAILQVPIWNWWYMGLYQAKRTTNKSFSIKVQVVHSLRQVLASRSGTK